MSTLKIQPDPLRTRADEIFERLYGLMLAGELPSGGEVNEAQLAQRFACSRGPVREAVQRLQGLRLIEREAFMRARVVSLSLADLVDVFELREAAEGMACRLATQRMSDAALERLLALVEGREAADANGARDANEAGNAGLERRIDFHVAVARASGNRQIERLLCQELYHLIRLYRARSGATPGRHEEASDEHWQIVRAMRARDADLAESLMRSHINRATRILAAQAAESGRKAAE